MQQLKCKCFHFINVIKLLGFYFAFVCSCFPFYLNFISFFFFCFIVIFAALCSDDFLSIL